MTVNNDPKTTPASQPIPPVSVRPILLEEAIASIHQLNEIRSLPPGKQFIHDYCVRVRHPNGPASETSIGMRTCKLIVSYLQSPRPPE